MTSRIARASWSWRPPALTLIAAAMLLAACAGLRPGGRPPEPGTGAPTGRAAAGSGDRERPGKEREQLERERQKLEEALRKETAANRDLEDDLARLHLLLLERDAQIRVLNQKLDAAILEVVRALAKLRGLESRAEAASNLAEAEVALKLLQQDAASHERDTELRQAQQLLNMGADEFRKENYGGALYLATQAKDLIKRDRVRSEQMARVDGEVPFALPLSLRALGKSNIREGPGPGYKVVFVVEEGTAITGHSYKGQWVRVRRDDGRSGWIFYNLVGQR